jgi:hypothetical protein
VTVIDPGSVKPTGDPYGDLPPGFSDGNPATDEEPGWRPIGTTPNHPEDPAAHGSITSAMAEVFSQFLATNQFDSPSTDSIRSARLEIWTRSARSGRRRR